MATLIGVIRASASPLRSPNVGSDRTPIISFVRSSHQNPVKWSRGDETRNQTPSGYWTVEGVEYHRPTNPGAPALAINLTWNEGVRETMRWKNREEKWQEKGTQL